MRGCRNLLDKSDKYENCQACREKDRIKDNKQRNKEYNGISGLDEDTIYRMIDYDELNDVVEYNITNNNNKNMIEYSDSDDNDDVEDVIEYNNNKNNKNMIEYSHDDEVDNVVEYNINNKNNKNIVKHSDNDDNEVINVVKNNNSNNIEIIKSFVKKVIKDDVRNNSAYKNIIIECRTCGYKAVWTEFINTRNMLGLNCQTCLDKNREKDRQRVRPKRDYTEEMRRNPQLKITKQKWKEENPDKVRGYWVNGRARQIIKKGDEYWDHNSMLMREWRKRTPDYNKSRRENPKYKYDDYKRKANDNGSKFELTYEQCYEFFKGKCYYCGKQGMLLDKIVKMNGIDRKIASGDYVTDNCVSCCKMCNYMKYQNTDIEYINMCEHILTNLGVIDGELHKELFSDSVSGCYSTYKYSANERKLKFTITEDEFNEICFENCYLCNKEISEYHINGIDRVINEIGYHLMNCKPCCSICNYFKNDFNLYSIIIKMAKSYKNHKNTNFTIDTIKIKEICMNILKNDNIKRLYKCEPKRSEMKDKKITEHDKIIIRREKDKLRKRKERENNPKMIKLTQEEKIEKRRIAQQKYRNKHNKPRVKLTEEEKLEKRRIVQQNYRNKNKIIKPIKNKITPEERRERDRIRKQKQRERTRLKYTNEENRQKEINRLVEQKKQN